MTAVANPGLNFSTSIAVPCPSGKRAIGGGGEIFGSGKSQVAFAFNDIHPVTDGSGYFVEAAEVGPTLLSWEVQAYAVCANVNT